MTVKDARVDVVDPEVIVKVAVKVATDVVMLVRVRKVVLRESLHLLSVVGLAEVVGLLLPLLRMIGILQRSIVDSITS
jgi:hypothetical protein